LNAEQANLAAFAQDAGRVALEVRKRVVNWALQQGYKAEELAFVGDGSWATKVIWTRGSKAKRLGVIYSNITKEGRFKVDFVQDPTPVDLKNLNGKIYMVGRG
jgi:hypothetical protein